MLAHAVMVILVVFRLELVTSDDFNFTQHIKEQQMYESGEYLSSKCIKNASPREYYSFLNSRYDLHPCILAKLPNIWQEGDEIDTVKTLCTESREHAIGCFKDVFDKMAVCLSSHEQYLPTFLMSWLENIGNYLCSKDAGVLKELIRVIYQKKDMVRVNGAYYTILKCFMKEFPKDAYEISDDIIEQKDFCGFVYETRMCLVQHQTENDEVPAVLNKLIITIADLATSSCVRH